MSLVYWSRWDNRRKRKRSNKKEDFTIEKFNLLKELKKDLKEEKMKRFIAILSIFILTFTSSASAFTYNNELLGSNKNSEEEKFEVYNGYGELLEVTDTLEEAEEYLAELNKDGTDEKSISSMYHVAKVGISKAMPVVLGACVIYKVGQVVLGKAQVIDVIDLIVPVKTLSEIAGTIKRLNIYSSSSTVLNPYPPHSAQGAWWTRNNFYYVIGN